MVKKQESYDTGITNEGGGYAKPTTAWAVEVDGEISPYSVVRTRELARYIRNQEAPYASKASVRKVELRIVKGAR